MASQIYESVRRIRFPPSIDIPACETRVRKFCVRVGVIGGEGKRPSQIREFSTRKMEWRMVGVDRNGATYPLLSHSPSQSGQVNEPAASVRSAAKQQPSVAAPTPRTGRHSQILHAGHLHRVRCAVSPSPSPPLGHYSEPAALPSCSSRTRKGDALT